jgi:hypothetical protein
MLERYTLKKRKEKEEFNAETLRMERVRGAKGLQSFARAAFAMAGSRIHD